MLDLLQNLSKDEVLYIVFLIAVIIFLVLDLGIIQKTPKAISTKSALIQSICWVALALAFGSLVWWYEGRELGVQYLSAYLMEKSLSIDNIFVFVLILRYFNVSLKYYHKVLFYGIIGAIVFRIIFILAGIVLVEKFHWILYIFGAILIYSGYKILTSGDEQEVHPEKNPVYKLMKRYFPMVPDEGDGHFTVKRDGKRFYTILFLVFGVIASTDIVFAVDSIPAVFAISQNKMVIITSNVFAVMGLRAMFFLLMGAVNKFRYLQEGISFVLMFIGGKMLVEFFDWHIPTEVSLLIILMMLGSAIVLSLLREKKNKE